MLTIKNIVVATDFSNDSAVAYRYARHLAARFGAVLRVVHIYQMPTEALRSDSIDYTLPSIGEWEEWASDRLNHFINEASNGGGDIMVSTQNRVKREVRAGFVIPEIIALSKEPETDLLILGSAGSNSALDRWLGSTAVDVAQKAFCPIILVPKKADYRGIHHILYTASEASAEPMVIRKSLDFAKYFNAAVHFVHFAKSKETDFDEEMKFKQVVERQVALTPYTVETFWAKDAPKGVADYSQKNDIDLLVAVTHHRDFLNSFFHHSITRDLAWEACTPLLVLHTDDKNAPPV